MTISCLLHPHAAAPDTEGTSRTELIAELEEIDTDCLNIGLQRSNVFIVTVGAATRVRTSTAAHGHRECRPNALEALMVRVCSDLGPSTSSGGLVLGTSYESCSTRVKGTPWDLEYRQGLRERTSRAL